MKKTLLIINSITGNGRNKVNTFDLIDELSTDNTSVTVFPISSDSHLLLSDYLTAIEKLDDSLLEASSDLGARPVATFFEVILPLTASGIFSGCLMVFIPCLGYFFVSDILGGGNSDVIGNGRSIFLEK